MNLLFSPELWSDGGSSPPIYWNASEQRYEVLVASSAGVSGLLLETIEGASAGDTIEFTYDVDGFFNTEPGGASDYTFRLVRTGSEEVLWSVQMSDAPVSGEISVDCEEGAQYQFEVYRDGGFGFSLYDFEAIITPTGSPDPEPAACFWTDIVNATQECGDGPEPQPQLVDAYLYAEAVPQWNWRDAVLFDPPPYENYAAPVEVVAPGANAVVAQYRKSPGNHTPHEWDPGDVVVGVGVIGTNGAKVCDQSESGVARSLGVFFEFDYLGDIHDQLPPSHQYVLDPEVYKYPPRTEAGSIRNEGSASFTNTTGEQGAVNLSPAEPTGVFLGAFNGGPYDLERDWVPSNVYNASPAYIHPFFGGDWLPPAGPFSGGPKYIGCYAIVNGGFTGGESAVDITLQTHVLVHPVAHVAAYINDLEFFPTDEYPGSEPVYEMPPEGTGTAIPAYKLLVAERWVQALGEKAYSLLLSWGSANPVVEDDRPDPLNSVTGFGFFVGSLRDAETDELIARVAIPNLVGG